MADIRAELPFLRSIPAGDANRLRKQHLDGAELIGKAGRAVAQIPSVMPGLFAKDDFVRDAALLEPVLTVRREVKSLFEELDDTARLLYDETSGQQTKVYEAFKAAAKDNAAARTLFEDMEKHHKKGGAPPAPPKAWPPPPGSNVGTGAVYCRLPLVLRSTVGSANTTSATKHPRGTHCHRYGIPNRRYGV